MNNTLKRSSGLFGWHILVLVGMGIECLFPVGFFDFLCRSGSTDPQDFVQIFLGGYNGVFCVSERTFGRTWLNPAVSGGMLGAAIGYGAHPSKVSVVAGAAATAALCTATDYAWGPAESRQRRGDRDGDV